MLGRLLPRDDQFFELFDQLAGHLATTAKLLDTLFSDVPHVNEHVTAIKDIEHKADLVAVHAEAKNIELAKQTKANSATIPWHPGAVRYFTEKGVAM